MKRLVSMGAGAISWEERSSGRNVERVSAGTEFSSISEDTGLIFCVFLLLQKFSGVLPMFFSLKTCSKYAG